MSRKGTFKLDSRVGDVVSEVPNNGVIVHACNCIGQWGSGIALQLKLQFPEAYALQYDHCQDRTPDELIGTCLLVSPQPEDVEKMHKKVHIACLFTSKGYGRKNAKRGNPGLSRKADVVKATRNALADLKNQLEQTKLEGAIMSVKFNAGSFKMPWEETRSLIEETFKHYGGTWTVVSPR